MATDRFGIYVHVPFCRHRCDYCAFATWTDKDDLIVDYVDAVVRDIRGAVDAGMPAAGSIFFGGGTPTRIDPELLARIVESIPVTDGAEVTVECNPDDVDTAMMRTYASVGVNRMSLGVQSMVPRVLALLGRTHDPSNVRSAVESAREAGVTSINVDLIYGSRTETVEEWVDTVRQAVSLDVTHVSAYGLTVEAGTALAADEHRHPDDDDQADKYIVADDILAGAGFVNYEISNWAREGHRCRHNELYWSQGDYRGFGCAAHSHAQGRRWWNVRTPERYIAAVRSGASTEAAHEVLDDETRAREALELALRTHEGVPAWALDAVELEGLVRTDKDRVVLTRQGRLLANEVSLRLRPR